METAAKFAAPAHEWTPERVMHYASFPEGFSVCEATSRKTLKMVAGLVAAGRLERVSRTVDLPEDKTMPESCKAVSMFDTWSARTVTLVSYHAVRS